MYESEMQRAMYALTSSKDIEHVMQPITSKNILAYCRSVLCSWQKPSPKRRMPKVIATLSSKEAVKIHGCDGTSSQEAHAG